MKMDQFMKQYVIIPKKPKMSPGKKIAQACHASFLALGKETAEAIAEWAQEGMPVIVLEAEDIKQMMNISLYCDHWDIKQHTYIDEGKTEVKPFTPTALATGLVTEKQEWIFQDLELM